MHGKHYTDKWYPIRLLDNVNHQPVTGKIYSNITVKYGFEGAASESNCTVTTNDWKEMGAGNYWLRMGQLEFVNFGKFTVRVSCANCDDCVFTLEVLNSEVYDGLYSNSYLPVKGPDGINLATEGQLQSLAAKEILMQPLSTTQGIVLGWAHAAVGSVIYWHAASFGEWSNNILVTHVTEADGNTLTWTPALDYVPDGGSTVYIGPNIGHEASQKLAIPANPATGSANERLKAIDDKLPSGTISDYDEHRGRANVGYDGTGLTVNAWLERRGEVVEEPTSCSVTVYDDAGTEQFALSEDTPDAQGVFKVTKTSPGLEAGKSYYAKVAIEAGGQTYETVEGISTL